MKLKLSAAQPPHRLPNRKGAVAVEFAMASVLFFLFLFGIIEYGRFVFMYNLLENATREGCRFAVVNTNLEPTPPDTPTDVVKRETEKYLSTAKDTYQNLSIVITAYVGQPGFGETLGQARPTWTDARVNDLIQVRSQADFKPILPQFLLMGNTIQLNCVAAMYSEAN